MMSNKINFQFASQLIATISLIISIFITTAESLWPNLSTDKCSGVGGGNLKYLSGDALTDSPNCIGPNGLPYPSSTIGRAFGGSSRKGRSHTSTVDPIVMQSTLLSAYKEANEEDLSTNLRQGMCHFLYP
jgi:hypothetical protein